MAASVDGTVAGKRDEDLPVLIGPDDVGLVECESGTGDGPHTDAIFVDYSGRRRRMVSAAGFVLALVVGCGIVAVGGGVMAMRGALPGEWANGVVPTPGTTQPQPQTAELPEAPGSPTGRRAIATPGTVESSAVAEAGQSGEPQPEQPPSAEPSSKADAASGVASSPSAFDSPSAGPSPSRTRRPGPSPDTDEPSVSASASQSVSPSVTAARPQPASGSGPVSAGGAE